MEWQFIITTPIMGRSPPMGGLRHAMKQNKEQPLQV